MFGVCLDGDQDANYLQIFIQIQKERRAAYYTISLSNRFILF